MSAYLGRKQLTDSDIEQLFPKTKNSLLALDYISKAYDIPVGLLRPEDTFTKEGKLWKYDSWMFWQGQDALNEYLSRNGIASVPESFTIADFVQLYDSIIERSGEFKGSPDRETSDKANGRAYLKNMGKGVAK